MVLAAAALFGLAVWLVANGRKATISQHRGVQFAVATVAVSVANIAALTRAHDEHDDVAELLSLAAGVTLVGALHYWAATLRGPTTTPKPAQ